jgi:hypothetical protein
VNDDIWLTSTDNRDCLFQGVLLGGGPAQEECDNEFKAADRDGDGVITYVHTRPSQAWLSGFLSVIGCETPGGKSLIPGFRRRGAWSPQRRRITGS